MPSNIFERLAALRAQRLKQDRELAELHQLLLDRGQEMLLVDEAGLQSLDEVVSSVSLRTDCNHNRPIWTGARC